MTVVLKIALIEINSFEPFFGLAIHDGSFNRITVIMLKISKTMAHMLV
ncbi:hypothetical protein [Liquorilactobacillus oeni]